MHNLQEFGHRIFIESWPTSAERAKVHTLPCIGDRDMEAGAVSVRLHYGSPQGAKPKGEVVADILACVKERRA